MIPLISLFPIGDDNTGRTIQPYVTYVLIAINIAVFVLLQGLGSNDAFTMGYSVVPREITHNVDLTGQIAVQGGAIMLGQSPQPVYFTLLSAMFIADNALRATLCEWSLRTRSVSDGLL